jgi:hypothetical protein
MVRFTPKSQTSSPIPDVVWNLCVDTFPVFIERVRNTFRCVQEQYEVLHGSVVVLPRVVLVRLGYNPVDVIRGTTCNLRSLCSGPRPVHHRRAIAWHDGSTNLGHLKTYRHRTTRVRNGCAGHCPSSLWAGCACNVTQHVCWKVRFVRTRALFTLAPETRKHITTYG